MIKPKHVIVGSPILSFIGFLVWLAVLPYIEMHSSHVLLVLLFLLLFAVGTPILIIATTGGPNRWTNYPSKRNS